MTFPAEGISRRCVADGRGEEAKNEEGKPNRDGDGAPTERTVSIRCSFFLTVFLSAARDGSPQWACLTGLSGTVALSAHGNVTRAFPAEGISRRRVADGRGVDSSHRLRIARLPMRFRLRGASRRSRWFRQQSCLAALSSCSKR